MRLTKCPLNKESYLLNHYKNGKDEVYLYERVDIINNYKYCIGSFIPSQTTGGNYYMNDYKEVVDKSTVPIGTGKKVKERAKKNK